VYEKPTKPTKAVKATLGKGGQINGNITQIIIKRFMGIERVI